MKTHTKKILILLFLSLFMGMSSQAQSRRLKKANKYYEQFNYKKAIKAYESIDAKTPDIYRKLAKSYLMLDNTEKAEQAYADLMATGQYTPEDVYGYASVLLMNKKYDEAADWMQKFYKLKPDDKRAQAFISNPVYYRDLLKSDPQMKIKNIGVNTKYEDFSPVYYKGNQVVFASSRGGSRLINRKWNGNQQPFLDLYVAEVSANNELTNVKKFTNVVNKKYHDAPATFNAAGDYMIVTRNIYNDKNIKDNKLWLYESYSKDGQSWEEPKSLYFNDKQFSNGHASLSPDGKVMYFASDRPGGFGGTDIYRSVKGADGKWSAPENLGDKINTEGNEMFPYYDAKGGYLFYSSNGLPGLGGLDIFVSKIRKDGSYTTPLNMGAPLNSNRDDFSFIYNDKGSGYISSNRLGGKGDDDIYSFNNVPDFKDKIKDCYISGTIVDKETREPLEKAKVSLLDSQGKKLKDLETDSNGFYEFPIDCGKVYNMMVSKGDYNEVKFNINTKEFDTPNIVKNFELERPDANLTEHQEMCDIKLEPIYYDLDKFYIRFKDKIKLDKIVSLMAKYPEMRLGVYSHTDSRASKAYNIVLSKNRTMSVVKYLTDHGVGKERLDPKWFGEDYPVNGCVDGVKCSEEEHQLNRRTEFKILDCDKVKEKEEEEAPIKPEMEEKEEN